MKKQFLIFIHVLAASCLLVFSSSTFANCDHLQGRYGLHPLLKDKKLKGLFHEYFPENRFSLVKTAEGMLIKTGNKEGEWMAVSQAKGDDNDMMDYLNSVFFRGNENREVYPHAEDEGRPAVRDLCALTVDAWSQSKGNSVMVSTMPFAQMTQAQWEANQEMLRTLFQHKWSLDELRQFKYFFIWSFNLPTVTGGVVFVPLKRLH